MSASKTHDIAIKVGEYLDKRDNKIKSRNRTIGKLMRSDDGHPFILINVECLSTQLFALARKKGDDTVILSCWEERDRSQPAVPTAAPVDDDDGFN